MTARIGNQIFDSLEDAIMAANSTDTINLINDTKLNNTLNINKTVNINLNNNTIEANEKVFLIEGGSLKLTGSGSVVETNPNYGAITLIGSTDSNKENYSTVSVGSDITLKGWSGIFITHNNKKSYGILVNMNGTIEAVNDINGGTGAGIYVNGHIKHEENAPIINISNNAKITSTGNGIYSAGYATYNINGADISGIESGLGIKSGIFNITNSSITGTGEDKTPTTGNNNGINPSGVAIQIESNPSYKGNIELNLKNNTIKSNHSNVIYEYTTNNTSTKVKEFNIKSGTFTSNAKKDVFLLSDSFKSTHDKFISGGTFSSDPSNYLELGYTVSKNNNTYEVISSTLSVFKENNSSNTKNVLPIILITLSLILGITTYILIKRKNIII